MIPARVLRPKVSKRATILLGGQLGDSVEKLLADGSTVMLPDVRFTGELKMNWHLNAVIWGRPEAGMIAHDVKRAVDHLGVDQARVVASGDLGIAALLAGILDPRVSVAADDLKSYRDGRVYPVIPNILRVGDVPEIAKLLGARLEN